MKKLTWAAAALIAALVFAGCALGVRDGGDSGSVSLSFAMRPGEKVFAGDDYLYQARVWVYSSNALVPVGAAGYRETILDAYGYGTVTIDNLPSGNAYQVVAAAGWGYVGEPLSIENYGSSDLFTVAAGAETAVPITLGMLYTNVSDILAGSSVKSVVNADGLIYAATGTTVYEYDDYMTYDYVANLSMTPPAAINSLSVISYSPAINTADGIYSSAEIQLDDWGEDPRPNVLQSGESSGDHFFRDASGFGGSYYSDTYSADVWTRIDLGAATGRKILDFVVYNLEGTYVMVATNFVGAFIMPTHYLNPEDYDLLGMLLDPALRGESSLIMFAESEYWGASRPLIQSFGLDENVTYSIYLGTTNGVYRTPMSDSLYEAPQFIPGTQGLNVSKIVPNSDYYNAIACIAGSRVAVITWQEGDVTTYRVQHLPFLNDLVGAVNDIAWDGATLLAVGSAGAARTDLSDILPYSYSP